MIFIGPGDPSINDYSLLIKTLDRVFGPESVTTKRLYETFRDTRNREFRDRVLTVVRMNRVDFGEVPGESFDYWQGSMLRDILRDYDRGWHVLANEL